MHFISTLYPQSFHIISIRICTVSTSFPLGVHNVSTSFPLGVCNVFTSFPLSVHNVATSFPLGVCNVSTSFPLGVRSSSSPYRFKNATHHKLLVKSPIYAHFQCHIIKFHTNNFVYGKDCVLMSDCVVFGQITSIIIVHFPKKTTTHKLQSVSTSSLHCFCIICALYACTSSVFI